MPPSEWKHDAQDGNLREHMTQALMSVLKLGDKGSVEVGLQLADDSVFQAQLDCVRTIVGDGLAALRKALTDTSERKQTEDTLRYSEQRFDDIARASADWIWEVNAEGTYTFASNNVQDMLGYNPILRS